MDAIISSRPGRGPSLLVPALLACYLIWGSTYLAIRWTLVSFPPFLGMGTRFVAAGALLFAWQAWRGAPWPGLREWRNAAIAGGLMLGGGMGLTATAEMDVGSGLVAAFVAVVPMLVCGWGLLFGERPGRLEVAGMGVGAAGVLLLVRGSGFSASPRAFACIAAATFAWSLGSVLSSKRFPLARGPMGFASEMLCGGAILLAISAALGEHMAQPPAARALAAWLYLVAFGSIVAFSAYLFLLANASPAMATSYAFVNPVIALFLGVAVGREHVSGPEWLACGVVLGGVFLIFRGKTHARQREKNDISQ